MLKLPFRSLSVPFFNSIGILSAVPFFSGAGVRRCTDKVSMNKQGWHCPSV